MCKQSVNDELVDLIVKECECSKEKAVKIVESCNISEEKFESIRNEMESVVNEIMNDNNNLHNINPEDVVSVINFITIVIQIPIIYHDYKTKLINKFQTIGIDIDENTIDNIKNRIKQKK